MRTIGAVAVRLLMAGVLIGAGSSVTGCSSGGEDGGGSSAGTAASAPGESTVVSVPTSIGEADPGPGTAAIDSAAAIADRLVAGFQDESTAMAAVLLARDKGYSVVQIIAAADGRLQADGAVLDEGGGVADPDGAPTGLLIDDVTGDAQQAGFRAREVRVAVSVFVEATEDYADHQGYGGLTLIFLAFETGYSLDQIVLQVLADGQSGFRETGPNDELRLVFYDESGDVIIPQSLSPERTAADSPTTTAALPPTHAELAAQEPIPLTDGSWRFFADSSEEQALYDFVFEPTGRFYEDDAEHNEGAYDADGASIEMTLVRVHTLTASDGENERTAEVAWNEWFTMTRTGNTMTGTWVKDSWIFGYDQGFVLRGQSDPAEGVFARPERPDDPG